jgi:predicted dehydrogenase
MDNNNSFVLNWAIYGTGLIAHDFCISLGYLNSDFHRINAVCDISINDAKDFSHKYNIESYYDSYDELLKSSKVNIVYIAVINTAHKEACLKAIDSGKHILCEKPVTLNLKELDEVLKAAKAKNVFFMEVSRALFF